MMQIDGHVRRRLVGREHSLRADNSHCVGQGLLVRKVWIIERADELVECLGGHDGKAAKENGAMFGHLGV
jgi:hypothetical protein